MVVELTLRAAGLYAAHARQTLSSNPAASIRIVCLGESTTASTPYPDQSWPAQLQEILEKKALGAYQVINLGGIGSNTSVLAIKLPRYLEIYKPNFVIAMIGVNDARWFGIVHRENGFRGKCQDLGRQLKLWKLAQYLFFESADMRIVRSYPGWAKAGRSNKNQAGRPRTSLRAPLEKAEKYMEMALEYEASGRHELARRAVKSALLMPVPLSKLGVYYERRKRMVEARRVYEMAISIRDRERWGQDDLYTLGNFNSKMGRLREAAVLYQRASVQESRFSVDFDPLTGPTRKNYREIATTVQRSGARFIAMQYPMKAVDELKDILRGFKDVTFIDNKAVFKPALAASSYETYFVDRFGGEWGHCTREGNRLIAVNAAQAILP